MNLMSKQTSNELLLQRLRSEFPILQRRVEGRALNYLDNAASFPKPKVVIDAVREFSFKNYANVHRSVHRLSQESTELYEGVRERIARDIGARSSEIIFTKGSTEGLNIVAQGLCSKLEPGDEIVMTRMEHHANFVPWQQMAKRYGLNLKIVELRNEMLEVADVQRAMSDRTKILALSAISNVLGSIQPISAISELARRFGVKLVVDGAQIVSHGLLKLSEWGSPDFLVFSGHKMGSPNGIGVLYGRKDLLEQIPPLLFGGDMILEVRDQDSSWNELPWRLEAGTPPIDAVIGLGAVWNWIQSLNWSELSDHEAQLTAAGLKKLQEVPGLRLFGPSSADSRVPTFSFELAGIHAHDLGTFLDARGICVRAGHHCTQPLHRFFNRASTIRASFGFYNTLNELDDLVECLQEAQAYFTKRGVSRP
jgi:cysteine desulfurase/selenocysteine lyase